MGQIDRCNHNPFKTCANLADNQQEFPLFQVDTIGIDIAYYSVKSESMWTVIRRKKTHLRWRGFLRETPKQKHLAKIKECIGDCIFYPIYIKEH